VPQAFDELIYIVGNIMASVIAIYGHKYFSMYCSVLVVVAVVVVVVVIVLFAVILLVVIVVVVITLVLLVVIVVVVVVVGIVVTAAATDEHTASNITHSRNKAGLQALQSLLL
jgi:hypothetical protein